MKRCAVKKVRRQYFSVDILAATLHHHSKGTGKQKTRRCTGIVYPPEFSIPSRSSQSCNRKRYAENGTLIHAIQFIAIMGPNQEHVAPEDLAVTLEAAFPKCSIDWEAGDRFTRENVANLEAIGIPEVMLEGARSFMGNRFVLTVDPCGDTPGELSGVVSTVHRELGDSLEFSMNPYHPQHLRKLAKTLATAIDFRYHLDYDESFSIHIEPSPCTAPLETAKQHLPISLGDNPEIQLRQIADWKTPFRTGLLRWLDLSDHKNKLNDSTRSFRSLAEYAAVATDDIQEIASPHDAWLVDVPEWPHQNCMLLAQQDCYTYISLPGVPKGIFGITISG